MIIALVGKGGVGKSTISSQLIRALSKRDVTLAVDADPNSNLSWVWRSQVPSVGSGMR